MELRIRSQLKNKQGLSTKFLARTVTTSISVRHFRSLKTQLAEHQLHTKNQRFDKSAVAEHATFNKHDIDWGKFESNSKRTAVAYQESQRSVIDQL